MFDPPDDPLLPPPELPPLEARPWERGHRFIQYLTEPQSIRSSVPSMITMKFLVIALAVVSSVVIANALGPFNK
jgi:hypothetical protein